MSYPIPNPNVIPPFPGAEPGAWAYAFDPTTKRATATFNGDVTLPPGPIPGLPPTVPPVPGTAPTNYYLDSAGAWAVPGTNWRQESASYTALPTDDVVFFRSVTTAATLTLPAIASVPSGKVLRVFVQSTSSTPPGSVSVAATGTDQIAVPVAGGSVTNVASVGPIAPPSNQLLPTALTFVNNGYVWSLINDSLPVPGSTPPLAGQVLPRANVVILTASGTYTPSAGLQYAQVECIGGGGGGGGVILTTGTVPSNFGAGGGGSGGYSRAVLSASQIGASQSITIGAAGAAGTGTVNATAGGSTSFGTLVSANGGQPGQNNDGSFATTAQGLGGLGAAQVGSFQALGYLSWPGNAGEYGAALSWNVGSNTATRGFGGAGGTMIGGLNGTHVQFGTGAGGGAPGIAGCGGQGAALTNLATAAATNGGSGGPGLVIVTEFIF